jgi:hypothetical protein
VVPQESILIAVEEVVPEAEQHEKELEDTEIGHVVAEQP